MKVFVYAQNGKELLDILVKMRDGKIDLASVWVESSVQ